MGLRCGKEAPDGGLKERESPRLEDGANSRGYHSSFSMGAQPTRMAGQSYCRLSIDWPEHATAGLHFLKEQSADTLATTGPQGPARAIPFLSPLAACASPGMNPFGKIGQRQESPARDSAESLEPSVVTPLPPSAAPLAHRRPSRNRAGAKGIPAGNGRCRLPAQRAAPWPSRGRAASNADLPPSWRLMLLAIAGRSFGYALLRLIVAVSASALGGCGLAWANDASNSQASAIAAPSQFSPEIPSQSSSLAR